MKTTALTQKYIVGNVRRLDSLEPGYTDGYHRLTLASNDQHHRYVKIKKIIGPAGGETP